MNEPPRQPLKTMRGSVVIALCAASALILALALYVITRPRAPETAESVDHSVPLIAREAKDIESVTVENDDGRYTCLYRGGALVLSDAPELALDGEDAQALIDCCKTVTALDTVLDTAAQSVRLRDFGLESPMTMHVKYTDGAEITLLIGDLSPADIPSHYAMRAGDTHIYTVDPYVYEAVRLTRESLRAFEQLSLNADLIDAVTIAGEISLDARNLGEFWQMNAPYDYPMDPTKTDALLKSIAAMRFSACIGRADDLTLADYGLDAPRATLTVRQARSLVPATDENGQSVVVEIPETTHTIMIGGMRDNTMHYALYDGAVYTTGTLTTDFLFSFSVENLLNRNPVSFPEQSLTSLTLASGGEETRYTVTLAESVLPNNELETDGYGNTVYRFVVTRDGQEIDSEQFLTWYAKFVVMQAQGWAKETVYQAKQPSLTLTIATSDHERQIVYYPYDLTHSACRVNGVALFYVDGDPAALYAERP